MQLLLRWVDRVTFVMCLLATAAVVVMMLQVTLDVIAEAVFNRPIPATLTLVAGYYMPLVTFLPLAYVERLGNHVAADVITLLLPRNSQKHLYGWIFLLCFVVTAFLTYATWIEAVDKFRIGSFAIEAGVKVPTWPVRFAAPVSYGLLAFVFLLKFVAYVAGTSAQRQGPSALAFFGALPEESND